MLLTVSNRLIVAKTAAHHISLLIMNFCHNFPLALSSTAAFRIGNFIGKNQIEQAKNALFSTKFWGTIFIAFNASALFF